MRGPAIERTDCLETYQVVWLGGCRPMHYVVLEMTGRDTLCTVPVTRRHGCEGILDLLPLTVAFYSPNKG